MSALAFDTPRAVKALCEAGAAEPLAEAFVKTIGDAISGNVATKADITASEAAVRVEIAESKTRVQEKITNVRAELKTDIGMVRSEIGDLEGRLYLQLWLMAAGIVGLTVALSSCSADHTVARSSLAAATKPGRSSGLPQPPHPSGRLSSPLDAR